VEYALSEHGERLMPVISQLSAWWQDTQRRRAEAA
jgi:DNA-binding HxlR family transcriptional regulator